MAYSAIIGGVDQFPLVSITGWNDAKAWIDTLDVDQFESLVHLAEYGWTENLAELRGQILAALKASPPDDSTVADTMAGLAKTLAGKTESSIFVSDGTMTDDGKPDAGWVIGQPDDRQPKVRSLATLNSGTFESLLAYPPIVPDFDSLGLAATISATEILARVRRKILNHAHGIVDLESDLDALDLLVAQAFLASQVAGAVSVFAGFVPPEPKVFMLKTPPVDWWKEEIDDQTVW